MSDQSSSGTNPVPRQRYVRAVGPRLRILLLFIFALVAVLAANSIYLSAIHFSRMAQRRSEHNVIKTGFTW